MKTAQADICTNYYKAVELTDPVLLAEGVPLVLSKTGLS
jgi:hypothetical protein